MEEKPDPRLALITGAAIKLMAEAGADASVIGHFALHYPAMVAAQLEPPPPPPPVQEIDLEALVRTAVQAVLGVTLSGAQLDKPRVSNTKRGRGVELVKRNVIVSGKRTSISLSADLYRQVVESDGAEQADKLVQGFVDQTPAAGMNRSAWVESQITQHLVLNQMTGSTSTAH